MHCHCCRCWPDLPHTLFATQSMLPSVRNNASIQPFFTQRLLLHHVLNSVDCSCSLLLVHGMLTKANHSTALWRGLISHLKASVKVKDRRIHLKSHSSCFVGSQAVDVVMDHLSHANGFEGISELSRPATVTLTEN